MFYEFISEEKNMLMKKVRNKCIRTLIEKYPFSFVVK